MASALGKVVVAVDDVIDNIDLLKRILTSVGYSFYGCSDGQSFLSLLDLVQPDLILLDVEMPVLDGFDLCRSIRQRPQTAHTPVLFVTGRNSHADLQRAIALGGNDFVVKPYDPIKLRARVDHWIQRAGSMQTGAPPNAMPAKPAPSRVSSQVSSQMSKIDAAHPSLLQNLVREIDRMPDPVESAAPAIAAQRPTERR